ncbi:hypothetical protein [Sphingomonas corticis]|uniref:hypothetical protein n=1 Tax=Sphingomonas corticis TaxID=2722791 RepID=UPI001EEFE688|nr:hypothetical protein [Sphingomonas corticis]
MGAPDRSANSPSRINCGPHATLTLIETAREYHELTGRHLQVYGDIGELFGVITHGLKLHRNYAQGSDGRIGNDLVEVKTITPFKANAEVVLNLRRNFSKVLIVRINADFEVAGRMVDRASLPRVRGDRLVLAWDQLDSRSSSTCSLEFEAGGVSGLVD